MPPCTPAPASTAAATTSPGLQPSRTPCRSHGETQATRLVPIPCTARAPEATPTRSGVAAARPLLLSLRATLRWMPNVTSDEYVTPDCARPKSVTDVHGDTMTLARTVAGPDGALTCPPRNWCPVTGGYSPTAARPAISADLIGQW